MNSACDDDARAVADLTRPGYVIDQDVGSEVGEPSLRHLMFVYFQYIFLVIDKKERRPILIVSDTQ